MKKLFTRKNTTQKKLSLAVITKFKTNKMMMLNLDYIERKDFIAYALTEN